MTGFLGNLARSFKLKLPSSLITAFFVVSITSWPRTMSGEGALFFGGVLFPNRALTWVVFWRGCRNHRRWLIIFFFGNVFVKSNVWYFPYTEFVNRFFLVCLHDFFVLPSPQQKRGGSLISNPEIIRYA